MQGAVYQMVAHGVSTGGLFLVVGMLSDRRHTRLIAEYGGLKGVVPRLTAVFLIITLSSIGLPSLNGFIGEFLVLLGAFRWEPRYAVFAATGVILSAVYMLWMVQRVYYGEVTNEKNRGLPDLSVREWLVIAPVVAMAIFMGLAPNVFLTPTAAAIDKVVERAGAGRERLDLPCERAWPAVRTLMLDSSFAAIVPMVCVTLAALAAMVAESFRGKGEQMPIGTLGVIGLSFGLVGSILLWGRNASSFGLIRADNFGLFISIILCIVGLLTIALSGQAIRRDGLPVGEYYTLTLFSIAGMMMMATATDLLTIFIALEILSIAVYVLTGLRRDSPQSTEAAFKYFLLGAFSSAFFLYGTALTYALTGSTRLDRIGTWMAAEGMHVTPMMLFAVGMLLVGFCVQDLGGAVPHVDAGRLRRARRPWSPASCPPG